MGAAFEGFLLCVLAAGLLWVVPAWLAERSRRRDFAARMALRAWLRGTPPPRYWRKMP